MNNKMINIADDLLKDFDYEGLKITEYECILGDYNKIDKGDIVNIVDKNAGFKLKCKVKKVILSDCINSIIKFKILEQERI